MLDGILIIGGIMFLYALIIGDKPNPNTPTAAPANNPPSPTNYPSGAK